MEAGIAFSVLVAASLFISCGTDTVAEDPNGAAAEERTGAWSPAPPPLSEGPPAPPETTGPEPVGPPVVVARIPVRDKEVLFIKRAPRTDPLWPSMGATGTLAVSAKGCMRLLTPGERPDFLLEWPPRFSLSTQGGDIRVLDGEGRTVARVGEEIRVDGAGGGTGRPPNLPWECHGGEYWSVKDVSDIPRADLPE